MPKKGADSKRDYLKYRDYYHKRETSPEGIKKRVERDQARTKAIKAGIISGPDDPRQVDHKRSIDKGGGNALSNLQAMSPTSNRKKYT